ncbi:hypothetical protein LUZ60_005335 [Juncus effusus]|nr:hypothetical protein LUZ60_005335 [Juncus effusus]
MRKTQVRGSKCPISASAEWTVFAVGGGELSLSATRNRSGSINFQILHDLVTKEKKKEKTSLNPNHSIHSFLSFNHSAAKTLTKMSLISQNAAVSKLPSNSGDSPPVTGSDGETKVDETKPKRKNKKRNRADKSKKSENKAEMKRLESALFGSLYSRPDFGSESSNPPQFVIDRSAGNELSVDEENPLPSEQKVRKPTWVDEEEERTQVDIQNVSRLRKLRSSVDEKLISGSEYVSRLRAQHEKLSHGTNWARSFSEESNLTSLDEESSDLLRRDDYVELDSNLKLIPGLLEFSKLTDVNSDANKERKTINTMQFHPNGQFLLTGTGKQINLFQVDGKRNPEIETKSIQNFPILKAAFLPNGSEAILSSRRNYLYSFDLTKASFNKIGPLTGRDEKSYETFEISPDSNTIAIIGNDGYILLLSAKTKQLIGTVKMNGTARSLAFKKDGTELLTAGGDGHVYLWDLRNRKCIYKGIDEGSLETKSLSVSHNNELFACGSSSGIVNVYETDEFLGGKRKPLKTVQNLVTTVDEIKFNFDGQIMAICSKGTKNALRLVHVPTFNVFNNWPGRMNLGEPRCFDFSPNGGFLTVGNREGRVLLFKLNHYQNA